MTTTTRTEWQEQALGLDWSNVNNWSWKEYVTALNINLIENKKSWTVGTEDSRLQMFCKVIYLYNVFKSKCVTSEYNNTDKDLCFPFLQKDLENVTYKTKYGNIDDGIVHTGIDLTAPEGTQIIAIADGEIKLANTDQDHGNYLAIYHSSLDKYSVYCHMNDLMFNKTAATATSGELTSVSNATDTALTKVAKGQVIGHVGHTGKCSPSDMNHLHFQINASLETDSETKRIALEKQTEDPVSYFSRLSDKFGCKLTGTTTTTTTTTTTNVSTVKNVSTKSTTTTTASANTTSNVVIESDSDTGSTYDVYHMIN